MRRAIGVDAGRTAGQDDPLGIFGEDFGKRRGKGQDFAVDLALADPPRDQLAVLGAEIKDDNRIVAHLNSKIRRPPHALRPPLKISIFKALANDGERTADGGF